MVNSTVIGADLALRHGALVDAAGNILYYYESPDGMNSSLESIYIRHYQAASMLPKDCIVVCDWDRTIASWGGKSNKKKGRTNSSVGTLLTLMNYGFGVCSRIMRNAEVQFVAPSAVREALGLPPQTSKEDVHKATRHLWPQEFRKPRFLPTADLRGDCVDAWLLAATYYKTRNIV